MTDKKTYPKEVWDLSDAAPAPLPGDAMASASLPDPLDLSEKIADEWPRLEPRRELAEKLRAMRRARGLSQHKLAEMLGIQQSAVARMESISGPWPAQETIAAFANVCGKKALLVFVDVDKNTEEFTPNLKSDNWVSSRALALSAAAMIKSNVNAAKNLDTSPLFTAGEIMQDMKFANSLIKDEIWDAFNNYFSEATKINQVENLHSGNIIADEVHKFSKSYANWYDIFGQGTVSSIELGAAKSENENEDQVNKS